MLDAAAEAGGTRAMRSAESPAELAATLDRVLDEATTPFCAE